MFTLPSYVLNFGTIESGSVIFMAIFGKFRELFCLQTDFCECTGGQTIAAQILITLVKMILLILNLV